MRRIIRFILPGLVFISAIASQAAMADAQGAPAATFYLSPASVSVSNSGSFVLNLHLTVTNDTTHTARTKIIYPANLLKVTNVTPGPAFGVVIQNDQSSGLITLFLGSTAPQKDDQLFATINFTALSNGNGTVVIDPVIDASKDSYVVSDTSGNSILNSESNASFNVNPPATTSPVSPPPAPQSKTSTPPAPKPGPSAAQNTQTPENFINTKKPGTIQTPEFIDLTKTSSLHNSSDKFLPIAVLPALAVASLLNRAFGLSSKAERIRNRRLTTKSEKRHAKESIAAISRRLHRKHVKPSEETVAELEARLKHGKE